MKKYIEKYNPKNVFFYDDNIGNVNAISGLCKEYFPEINISTYHVQDGKIRLIKIQNFRFFTNSKILIACFSFMIFDGFNGF